MKTATYVKLCRIYTKHHVIQLCTPLGGILSLKQLINHTGYKEEKNSWRTGLRLLYLQYLSEGV